MTKEFAIALLKQDIQNSKRNISYRHNEVGIEALELAIKALEQQLIPDTRQRERQLEMEYQNGYDRGWEAGRKALKQKPCEDTVSCNCTTEEIAKSFIEDVESVKDQLNGQLCEDCISRAEALKAIEEEKQDWGNTGVEAIDGCLEAVGNLPSVTPSIPDVENDFNLGYNCGYTDAMIDIAESEDKE